MNHAEDSYYGASVAQEPSYLSYAEDTTYEEQVAALPVEPARPALDESSLSGLKGRISRNKVYLPPENVNRGKRKRGDEMDDVVEDEDAMMVTEDGLRPNALYLYGNPLSHLPTNNIFGYARHYKAEPVALEWIDDKTCVLVFSSSSTCTAALMAMQKADDEVPDLDDCVTAKPVPLLLWPAEDRINKTLGMGEGLKDPLLIRVARSTDKKARGAKSRSQFYQKHGMDAGKDPNSHSIGRATEPDILAKRQRTVDDGATRQQLDDELDSFLAKGDDENGLEEQSKMYADSLTSNGREKKGQSLLDRTSVMRLHPSSDNERRHNSSGSRRRRRQNGHRSVADRLESDSEFATSKRSVRTERPSKTREELDDELEAFLRGS